jgi:hypothetical protein
MRSRPSGRLWLLSGCLCLVSLFSLGSDLMSADDIRSKLNVKVQRYDLSAQSFVDALTVAAAHFQLPIGIQWVDTPAARSALTLHWRDTTVESVIRDIVKTQSGYQVVVKNGVVHVVVPSEVPGRQNFLQVKLQSFQVQNEPVDYALRELRKLVRLRVSPPPRFLPGRGGGIVGSGLSTIEQPLVNLDLSNVTAQDILDSLASSSPRQIWIVTFSADRTLTPTGYRRTLSLWNPSPVPDSEQPVWDMFHWGDPIPPTVLGMKH